MVTFDGDPFRVKRLGDLLYLYSLFQFFLFDVYLVTFDGEKTLHFFFLNNSLLCFSHYYFYRVTALSFDHEDLRLLVGCNSGQIRLFNYGNGQLLKKYQLKGYPDVSGMCSVRQQGETLLYGASESAEVYMWKDTDEPTAIRPIIYDRLNCSAHELDVSCLISVPPDLLVSCSFDGKVNVWQRGVLKHSLKDPSWADRPMMTLGMHKICFLPYQAPLDVGSAAPRRRRGDEAENHALLHIVVAAGTDGCLHFWNLSAPLVPQYLFQTPVFPQTKGSFGVV